MDFSFTLTFPQLISPSLLLRPIRHLLRSLNFPITAYSVLFSVFFKVTFAAHGDKQTTNYPSLSQVSQRTGNAFFMRPESRHLSAWRNHWGTSLHVHVLHVNRPCAVKYGPCVWGGGEEEMALIALQSIAHLNSLFKGTTQGETPQPCKKQRKDIDVCWCSTGKHKDPKTTVCETHKWTYFV